ncbi:MAG: RHS repeat domain-containing protein [Bacteroidota bacterium]
MLTSLVNAAGQTITFTYNPAGKLATMVMRLPFHPVLSPMHMMQRATCRR